MSEVLPISLGENGRPILSTIFKYVFVLTDGALAIFLSLSALVGITGVHTGLTPTGLLTGLAALVFAVGAMVSAYAVEKNRPWQRPFRTALYMMLFAGLACVLGSDIWHVRQDWIPELVLVCFPLASLLAYLLWFRYR